MDIRGWPTWARRLWDNDLVRKVDPRWYELLLIFILSLLPLIWAAPGLIIDQFDYNFSFDPLATLNQSLQVWGNYDSLGALHPREIAGISPNNLYYVAMQTIGMPLWLSQRIMFVAILFCAGASMYCLFRIWDFGPKAKRGAIFAAVLYMFSPIAAIFLWNQFTSSYYSFMFLPLVIALVIYGIRNQRGPTFACITALIATVLLASAYMNPVRAALDLGLVLIVAATFIVIERKKLRPALKLLVPLVLAWFVLNLFWIVPEFDVLMLQTGGSNNVGGINVSNVNLLYSNTAPMSNVFLETGYWALYGTYHGDHWYSWSLYAQSWIYIMALGVISMLAWASLVVGPKRRGLLPLALVSLFCIFMVNGNRPPFSELFSIITDHGELTMAFRSMYQLFGPVLALCMAVMFGCTCGLIAGRVGPLHPFKFVRKETLSYVLTVLIIISLIATSLPFLTGDVINKGGETVPSAAVAVPDDYYQAAAWLDQQSGDYNIFSLPYNQLGYAAFSWENGIWAQDPTSTLLSNTVLTNANEVERTVLVHLADAFAQGHAEFDTQKVLSILNVKYVLLHGDANWDYINGNDWWASYESNYTDYYNSLVALGYQKVAVFGDLVLFENPLWVEMHYYDTDNLLAVCGGWDGVCRLTSEGWYDASSAAFVISQDGMSALDQLGDLVDAWYFASTDARALQVERLGGYTYEVPEDLSYIDSADGYVQYHTTGTLQGGSMKVYVNGRLTEGTSFQLMIDGKVVVEGTVTGNAWTDQNMLYLGTFNATTGWAVIVLRQNGTDQAPSSFIIVPETTVATASDISSAYYSLAPMSQYIAVKEAGKRLVVSTNGTGDGSMIVFDSLSSCPYADLLAANGTYTVDFVTIVYVQAGGTDLGISAITADNHLVPGIVMLSESGSAEAFQGTSIPAGERAVIMLPGNYYRYVTMYTTEGKVTLTTSEMNSAAVAQWYGSVYQGSAEGQVQLPRAGTYTITVRSGHLIDAASTTLTIGGVGFDLTSFTYADGVWSYSQEFSLPAGLTDISLRVTGNATVDLTSGLSMSIKDAAFRSLEQKMASSNATADFSYDTATRRTQNGSISGDILVLTENYDDYWQCSGASDHFLVNYLCNGFVVEKQEGMVLTFSLQSLVNVSMTVSLGFMAVLIIAVPAWMAWKRRSRK